MRALSARGHRPSDSRVSVPTRSDPKGTGGTLAYDKKKLELRRFEVQVHYHSAYQYWNLRGILAEKWAHGPHFGGVGGGPDHVSLTPPPDTVADLIAVYGLKVSAFNWERPDPNAEAQALALEWLGDCIEVLAPRHFVSVQVKTFHLYPLRERDAVTVAKTMTERYPGIDQLWPGNDDKVYPGLTYQARGTNPYGTHLQTAIYGIYNSDQRAALFASERNSDPKWALGLQIDRYTTLDAQFTSGLSVAVISDIIDRTRQESLEAIGRTLVWDIGNA